MVAGKTFVTPNSAVTISLNSAYASDYDLVSYDGNTVDSVTYTFDEEFTVDFVQSSVTIKEHETTYVSVYSEVSVEYIYNGANVAEQLAGSENIYLIPDYAVNGTLPAIATSEDNHYFLGWANKDATGNYQFVASATVDVFYEEGASELTTPDYYAIWAYNESQKLTSTYSVASDTADLPGVSVIKAAEGSVYSWYTNKDFTGNAITTLADLNGSTIVYARLQFKLEFNLTFGGSNLIIDGNNRGGDLKHLEYYVYEGNYVSVTYSHGSHRHGLFGMYNSAYTQVSVTLSESVNQSETQLVSFYLQSTSNNSNTRCFYPTNYVGDWSYDTVLSDSNRLDDDDICRSAATKIIISGNASIAYTA